MLPFSLIEVVKPAWNDKHAINAQFWDHNHTDR